MFTFAFCLTLLTGASAAPRVASVVSGQDTGELSSRDAAPLAGKPSSAQTTPE